MTNGKIGVNSIYHYSTVISVSAGDVIYIINPTTQVKMMMRFVTVYSEGSAVEDCGESLPVYEYTVPEGIDELAFTCYVSYTDLVLVREYTEKELKLKNEYLCETLLSKINSGILKELNIIRTTSLGGDSVTACSDILEAGNTMVLEKNTVNSNKNLSFMCDIDASGLSEGNIIRIGHGYNKYNGNWVEIDNTNITVYAYASTATVIKTAAHGLTVADFLSVNISQTYNKATITVMTSSGMYELKNISWYGRNGNIFAECIDCSVENVRFNWNCNEYKFNVYAFGDSYFNTTSSSRWPYYLISHGYTGNMLFGYAGMGTAEALLEFKTALTHGTPQFAVWCVGMNNSDSESAVNTTWLDATETFIEICNDNGITPVLSTIPNTPTINHTYKNEWIVSCGYRYIDFAHAVGASDDNVWYDGMLYSDNCHPTDLGAMALYMQAITDCPELMQK